MYFFAVDRSLLTYVVKNGFVVQFAKDGLRNCVREKKEKVGRLLFVIFPKASLEQINNPV